MNPFPYTFPVYSAEPVPGGRSQIAKTMARLDLAYARPCTVPTTHTHEVWVGTGGGTGGPS
jgi:hypothetical protein